MKSPPPPSAAPVALGWRCALGLLCSLWLCYGCAGRNHSTRTAARPVLTTTAVANPVVVSHRSAADTLAAARALDRRGQPQAVDGYFHAAAQAASTLIPGTLAEPDVRQTEAIYRQALAGLIDAGQRYGRLDPRGSLTLSDGTGRRVHVRYLGFAWQARDFSRLQPATQTSHQIATHYANAGLGLPLIVEREPTGADEPYFAPWQPFAATALLRPASDCASDCAGAGPVGGPGDYVLEFYNPLVFDTVCWYGMTTPLAGDITAPVAAIVNETPRQYLRGFTAPSDVSVRPRLTMLEPYQPGKIPVVFIHGLYSDALTWADMINELRAQRELYDQFQFWTYRYPTGGDLMASAAALRAHLRQIPTEFDPEQRDPALRAMVLVGHSLGGLVSKMQVTTSYDLLWREAAVQPFSALRAPPAIEAQLAEGFFFDPVESVDRVVFIGTPHHGSSMASRAAGRVGNLLVQFGTADDQAYQQLIAQNCDVFKPILHRRRPTTISLLEPDSPFLDALKRMPVRAGTHLHTIVGTGGYNPLEPGDGVVPISSARHPGESELYVPSHHETLHRHPDSIAEVARILREHAAQQPAQQAGQ